MTLSQILILLGAGLVAGLMNSVAGGGSFVVFPALIFLGMPPIVANATATLATWPGTFATMFVYRQELLKNKAKLPLYITISVLGGLLGALLLLRISNATFANMVPYLLLLATLLFTFRAKLLFFIRKFSRHEEGIEDGITESFFYRALMILLFIAISVYGGFFGAGMGILTLALFSMMGMQNLHEMNGLRSCCGFFANTLAILLFGSAGIIEWQEAIIMAVGTVSGGYFGARYALKMPQSWGRNAVVIIGWSMTIYFFWKQFL